MFRWKKIVLRWRIGPIRRRVVLRGVQKRHGKTDDLPMMSHPNDVLNDSFVSYQDLSEYVGLSNIKRGFPGEAVLKKHYKT